MIKILTDFLGKVNGKIILDKKCMLRKGNRFFMVSDRLKEFVTEEFFYAGVYLGKIEKNLFIPSFSFLAMIAKGKANKIVVDKKTEWLFICGRDIFRRGILNVVGSKRKDDYTIVLNVHGECLGFGKILHDLNGEKKRVVVKNISDVGDFLRREK